MSQLEPGYEFFETTTQSAYAVSLFRFCSKLNRLVDQIMFIDFILLSHPYDKSLGVSQSFNFAFFQFYERKIARRLGVSKNCLTFD